MAAGLLKCAILAAGMSSRLGPLTEHLPKSCLAIDEGVTMLERNLRILELYGFGEVLIVTGHAGHAIEDFVEQRASQTRLTTLHNSDYSVMNNIYTCYLLRDFLDEDTLIMNSDLVIGKGIVELAAEMVRTSDESFMMVDDRNPLDEESMKVHVDMDMLITRVNKSLDIEKSHGEYIGILRLSKSDIPIFLESTEGLLEAGETGLYYEDAIDRSSDKLTVRSVSTEGVPWTEVDTLADLDTARGIAKSLKSEIIT